MPGTGTGCSIHTKKSFLIFLVSMPSRAWVVTALMCSLRLRIYRFNALTGLSCYSCGIAKADIAPVFQCPHGLELLLGYRDSAHTTRRVSMPSRAWVVTGSTLRTCSSSHSRFNALTGLSCYSTKWVDALNNNTFQCPHGLELLRVENPTFAPALPFQCPHGLELLHRGENARVASLIVSMPSRAWVVTSITFPISDNRNVSMPSRAWVVTTVSR